MGERGAKGGERGNSEKEREKIERERQRLTQGHRGTRKTDSGITEDTCQARQAPYCTITS